MWLLINVLLSVNNRVGEKVRKYRRLERNNA